MLTDRFIRNAKPGMYADEGGLYLQVYPSGKRVFLIRSQANSKQTKRVIGAYPQLMLAKAREIAGHVVDPTVPRTFGKAFELYYEHHLEREHRKPEQTLRLFLRDLLPVIGRCDLISLTRAQLTSVLQRIVDRGSPVMANHALVATKRFLSYCEQRGWMPTNPLAGVLRRTIGGRETPKSRNLSLGEIADFLQLLRGDNSMAAGTRWVLYFCLLTGARASEALYCLREKTLVVPETKNTRPHRFPATPHVRAVLRRVGEVPRDHRVLSHALRRLGQTFTPHDLRRTLASRLSDLGVAPHVVEKLLNHKMTGVMAVYNRAEYWPERVAAQRLWGKEVAKLRRRRY